MNTFSLEKSLSVSVRVYRALLAAYPKKFREHYETQMVQVFRDSLREAYQRHSMPGVIDLWLHFCVDLFVTALVERIMERSQYMFSPKVILWGGLAGAFSGLLWMVSSSRGVAGILALILGLAGLAALYSRQAGQGEKLGLGGFSLAIVGTLMLLATEWWFSSDFFSGPSYLAVNLRIERNLSLVAQAVLLHSVGLVTLGVGLALLGFATLRAKSLPRWHGLPLGLGLLNILQSITIVLFAYVPLSQGRNPFDPWPPQGYTFIVAGFVLLGAGWIGLGAMLAAEGDARIPVAQPPSTSA